MPDFKISDDPAVSSIVGTELIPCVQSGANKNFTPDDLKDFINAGGLAALLAIGSTTGVHPIVHSDTIASKVPYLNGLKQLASSVVTQGELEHLAGCSANIETRLNALETGLSWKEACRAAIDSNVILAGIQTAGGVSLNPSDRVLVFGQTDPTENGIYIVNPGGWTRADDFNDASFDDIFSSIVAIQEGDYADRAFICTNNEGDIIGTDDITFTIWGGTTYTGGTGIDVSGNTISIKNTWGGQTSINTLGTITTGTWHANSIETSYTDAKIKGSVAATAGLIPYATGTLDEITTSGNLKFTGTILEVTGDISLKTAGNKINVKTGTNSCVGTANLTAGSVVIPLAWFDGNTVIFVTRKTPGGTTGDLSWTAGTGQFTINSSSGTDTSTVSYIAIELIP